MTNREKKLRAEAKKRLQKEGLLPADKPKLNRRKFIEEAKSEWLSMEGSCFIGDIYLLRAIGIMLGQTERMSTRASPEAVGAAKVLKIAIRLKEHNEKIRAEGRRKHSVMEEYEFIRDILDA